MHAHTHTYSHHYTVYEGNVVKEEQNENAHKKGSQALRVVVVGLQSPAPVLRTCPASRCCTKQE